MTGFEPMTTRPPDAYSTRLSYIPKKNNYKFNTFKIYYNKGIQYFYIQN